MKAVACLQRQQHYRRGWKTQKSTTHSVMFAFKKTFSSAASVCLVRRQKPGSGDLYMHFI
jgi:hypothetical protein